MVRLSLLLLFPPFFHRVYIIGADPFNGSSQGSPEAHTNDPIIRQTLEEARSRALSQGVPQPTYAPEAAYGMAGPDPKYGYYPQPYYVPAPYPPYGYMPGPPSGPPGSAPYGWYGSMPPGPSPDHQPHQQDMGPQSPFSPQSGSPPGQGQHMETKSIPCRYVLFSRGIGQSNPVSSLGSILPADTGHLATMRILRRHSILVPCLLPRSTLLRQKI